MLPRNIAKRRAVKTSTKKDWIIYRSKRNEVNSEIKRVKNDYYQKSISSEIGNPKKTWKALNDLIGKKSDITKVNEVIDPLLGSVTNAKDIANCFNNHFTTLASNLASQLQQPPVNPETYQ